MNRDCSGVGSAGEDSRCPCEPGWVWRRLPERAWPEWRPARRFTCRTWARSAAWATPRHFRTIGAGAAPLVAGFATRQDHGQRGFVFDGVMRKSLRWLWTPDGGLRSRRTGKGGRGHVPAWGARGQEPPGDWKVETLTLLGPFMRGYNQAGDIAGFMPITETQGLSAELSRPCGFVLPAGSGMPVDLGNHRTDRTGAVRTRSMTREGLWVAAGVPMTRAARAVSVFNGVASDLGTSGGAEACAYAASNAGTVVGYWMRTGTPTVRAAAAWTLDAAGQVTQRTDLGMLPVAPGAAAWS